MSDTIQADSSTRIDGETYQPVPSNLAIDPALSTLRTWGHSVQ